jgi:hypothetical protein
MRQLIMGLIVILIVVGVAGCPAENTEPVQKTNRFFSTDRMPSNPR